MVIYDIGIIGGGPAGMSAALWCSDLGLRSVLIEKNPELGGQLSIIHNLIRNYLGLGTADGEELREHFLRSLDAAKFDLMLGRAAVKANLETHSITTDDGSILNARSLIIATGVRRRKLGVEGENEFFGNGILASGAREAATVKGKDVVIVGGGDAAIENALILSEHANWVTVVHRRSEFRARDEFLTRLSERRNVTVLSGHVIERFEGDVRLRRAAVRNLIDTTTTSIPCDFGLIRIGVQPNNELFSSQLEMDNSGYIKVDANCRSSVENVYAVGDVAHPASMTISSAAGNSANAISHFFNKKKTT